MIDAGWTRGLTETLDWIDVNAGPEAFAMIDAPLSTIIRILVPSILVSA